jgi:uncharacterized protein (TIGR02145 family)
LPSDAEWTTLIDYVGGSSTAGTKLKAKSGWNSYSGVRAGTDAFGFAALPGGDGYSDSGFLNVGNLGRWWSSSFSELSSYDAHYRDMSYNSESVAYGNDDKDYLFSVRCLQD